MRHDFYFRLKQSFSDLIFEETTHRYFIPRRNGLVQLPSVSSIVSSFAPKFDRQKWLTICARAEKTSESLIDYKWKNKNAIACALGHKVHDFMEHYTGIEVPTCVQEEAGIEFLKDVASKGNYEISIRELRTYSEEFSFAGTMDLPILNRTTGKLIVADYKTNQTVEDEDVLFKSYDFLYEPFNMMDNSPYNKYQIQLSLYQILLEEKGYEIEDRWLVHLKSDGTYKIFPLYDLTKHLRTKLALRKFAA